MISLTDALIQHIESLGYNITLRHDVSGTESGWFLIEAINKNHPFFGGKVPPIERAFGLQDMRAPRVRLMIHEEQATAHLYVMPPAEQPSDVHVDLTTPDSLDVLAAAIANSLCHI